MPSLNLGFSFQGNMSDVVSKSCLTLGPCGSFGLFHPVDLRIPWRTVMAAPYQKCEYYQQPSVPSVTSPASVGQEAMQRASMTSQSCESYREVCT